MAVKEADQKQIQESSSRQSDAIAAQIKAHETESAQRKIPPYRGNHSGVFNGRQIIHQKEQ